MASGGPSYFSESVPEIVIRSLFRKYDTDSSNRLQKRELMALLKDDLGMDPKQAEAMMMMVDKDGSGAVSFDEFFQWFRGEGLKNINNSTRYFYIRKAVDLFKTYDKDASGTIEGSELKGLLKSVGYTGSVENALKVLDKDGNNKVSFPEFLQWLNWIPQADELTKK